jgi:hypothetical protein
MAVRPVHSLGRVMVSFVVRIVNEALAEGECVGRVYAIDSDEEVIFHSFEELAGFLATQHVGDPPPWAGTS